MPELALPDAYQGADPHYHFVLVDSPPNVGGGGFEYVLFQVADGLVARLRFVSVDAIGNGTVGTYSASLYGLYSFGVDQRVGYGGEIVAPAPFDFPSGQSSRLTWSTDVDTAYAHVDSSFGNAGQVPLPLSYLPGGTVVSVNYHVPGGSDAQPYVSFAQVVLDLFHASEIGAGPSGNADLYLLPALG